VDTVDLLRWLGGILELGGIFTVGWGIARRRREFSTAPGVLGRLKRLFGPVLDLFRRPRAQTIHAPSASVDVSAFGRATVRTSRNWDELGPEERVEELRHRSDQLRNEVDSLREQLGDEVRSRMEGMNREAQARSESEERLDTRIRSLAAADLRVEAWGAFAVSVGVVLQTLAPDIAG
jgi:hypothetical protein